MKKLLRILLTAAMLAVLCFAIVTPEASAQSGECSLFVHTSFVNPQPPATSYPNGTTDLVVRVKNQGSAACSYKISTDYFEGPNFNGTVVYATPTVQGPTLQPGTTKTHSWGAIPMARPCFYRVAIKYRKTPWSPDDWHSWQVQWC